MKFTITRAMQAMSKYACVDYKKKTSLPDALTWMHCVPARMGKGMRIVGSSGPILVELPTSYKGPSFSFRFNGRYHIRENELLTADIPDVIETLQVVPVMRNGNRVGLSIGLTPPLWPGDSKQWAMARGQPQPFVEVPFNPGLLTHIATCLNLQADSEALVVRVPINQGGAVPVEPMLVRIQRNDDAPGQLTGRTALLMPMDTSKTVVSQGLRETLKGGTPSDELTKLVQERDALLEKVEVLNDMISDVADDAYEQGRSDALAKVAS